MGYSWDEPSDPVLAEKWRNFEDSIKSLKDLNVQRMLVPVSLSTAEDPDLHIFSDASEQAVSAVAYLKVQWDRQKHIGFVMGKAKVAPAHGHTIPRLERCATVLATELAEIIIENLDVTLKAVKYYTDSKVVLGYINNKTRRFYVYVSNRVERVLKQSLPQQWNYVFTKNNPTDCGTRGVCTLVDLERKWLKAPDLLSKDVKDGDVILLKDKNVPRREWCVGVVVHAIKSDSDGKVRKAEVRVRKEGSDVVYVRPVTEMVVLMEKKQ